MKKVAFISDIHSNLPALEAVLESIENDGADEIYCLGDVIGYHSFPNEVIKLMQESGIKTIMGNHDKMIIEEDFDRENEGHFIHFTNFDFLTEESAEYIKNLPESMEIKIEDVTVKLVHGSPESVTEYIREGSAEISKYMDSMTTDVLMCGHTHIPYIVEEHGKYVINTGSVGKPKVGRPEVSYVLLIVDGNTIAPEIRFAPYDLEVIIEHLKEKNFPEKLITALKTGLP